MRKREVIVPIIVALITGCLSNYDKISKSVIEYTQGNTSSQNYDQELRIMLEKTGMRRQIDTMNNIYLNRLSLALALSNKYQNQPDKVKKIIAIQSRYLSYDNLISKSIDIFKHYYTLDDIENLNKIYSIPFVQRQIERTPIIITELMPIFLACEKEAIDAEHEIMANN